MDIIAVVLLLSGPSFSTGLPVGTSIQTAIYQPACTAYHKQCSADLAYSCVRYRRHGTLQMMLSPAVSWSLLSHPSVPIQAALEAPGGRNLVKYDSSLVHALSCCTPNLSICLLVHTKSFGPHNWCCNHALRWPADKLSMPTQHVSSVKHALPANMHAPSKKRHCLACRLSIVAQQ